MVFTTVYPKVVYCHAEKICIWLALLFTLSSWYSLGIWSDCPNKAPTVCLQQLLYEPRPEVHSVVPQAAAPHRGGEVRNRGVGGRNAASSTSLVIYWTTIWWQPLGSRTLISRRVWRSRKIWIEGIRRCALEGWIQWLTPIIPWEAEIGRIWEIPSQWKRWALCHVPISPAMQEA